MIIEITGARFSNKGAQLMLATVCQRLREAVPDVRLCMPMDYDTYEDRARYGLHFTLRSPEYRNLSRRLARDLLTGIVGETFMKEVIGLVPEREVDGLIDISGYAFGDKWSVAGAKRLARRATSYERRGKPVVMLPQMLGPFTKPGQADAFRELASHVDLIYAREQESFDHAQPLVDQMRLRLAPDITIPTRGCSVAETRTPYACIVPNSKLLEPNPQQQNWASKYLDRLVLACRHLASHGIEVKIVQHEYNAGDTTLVSSLQQELRGRKDQVVRSSDPQVLKGVLGGAQLVIGSRFHSLVSALSMGVPVVALGWAHKYDALLRDFGAPGSVHYADSPSGHLTELIDDTLRRHDALTQTLADQKIRLVERVEAMWAEVLPALGISLPHEAQTPESAVGAKPEISPVVSS